MSTTPLSEDDARWLIVRTAASLARLWARLDGVTRRAGIDPMHAWVSQDIAPPEPWLDVLPRNVALSGVTRAVVLAQGLLLAEATAGRAVDRRHACLIVQHIQCGAIQWSTHTLKLAASLGVDLQATPGAETNGTSLHSHVDHLARMTGTKKRPEP